MPKNRLKPGFDPIWSSEFLDIKLKKMSRTAFILRQMYRSYRNPGNNTCNLSDLQVRNITGWDRGIIHSARRQLIRLGEIIPTGYHSFAVKAFHQLDESCGKIPQPPKTDLRENPPTTCGKIPHHLRENPATTCGKNQQLHDEPIYTDTDKTDSFSASPVSKEENSKTTESVSREDMLKPEGIRTLRMLYGNNVIAIKAKLALMGITEAEADQALGRA